MCIFRVKYYKSLQLQINKWDKAKGLHCSTVRIVVCYNANNLTSIEMAS